RAVHDIGEIARLDEHNGDLSISMASVESARLRLTTFKRAEPIPLYTALPILESFGFKVIGEGIYSVVLPHVTLWIQEFAVETANEQLPDPNQFGARLKEALALVLRGEAENDGFNAFVINAGFDWREAVLVRALCKYLLQTRLRYSQSYMEDVL